MSSLNSALSTPDASHLKPFHSNIILNEPAPPKEAVFFDDDELREYLQNGTDMDKNPEVARLWNQFNISMSDPLIVENNHQDAITNEDLVQKISENYKLSPEEVEYFKEVTLRELLLFIYPFAPTTTNNQVMKVLLEYLMVFKYLVYALMALSASCLFTITNDRKHHRFQKKATAICMKLLVSAFGDLKNNENSLWHIEGLLLTVLLLTMLFCDMTFVDTATVPVSWTAHLNKARSLLVKYNTVKTHVYSDKPDSPGISIARLLFFSYDCISKFSVPLDKITRYDLHDLWMLSGEGNHELADNSVLKKLGVLITPTANHPGFNLLTAFPNDVFKIVYKFLDVVASINEKVIPPHATPQAVAEIIAVLSHAMLHPIIPNVLSDDLFLIPLDNPAHPDSLNPHNRIILPSSAYARDTDCPNQVNYYSWCDVALRSHMLFLYIRVLTTKGLLHLHRKHPMIQALVQQTIGLMFFLKPKTDPCYTGTASFLESENYWLSKSLFDFRAIMIQLPFRLALDLTDKDDDFEKLDLYFRGLVKFGGGSCMEAVGRAKKNREIARQRKFLGKGDEEDYEYSTSGFLLY